MSSNYKYPYIPDKKLYAAVMGACRYIRSTGWFNKAVNYYAGKYDVDPDDVVREVRKRQAAGQAGRKRGKFKYYAVEYTPGTNSEWGINYFSEEYASYKVVKAMSKRNAEVQMCKNDAIFSDWGPVTYIGRMKAFDNKKDAENQVTMWIAESKKKFSAK